MQVSVVITDVDNTLYDWVGIWHACFSAMLRELVELSGVPQAVLEADFREVHTRHGTSEYAFAIEELTSLKEKQPNEDLTGIYAPAIEAYRTTRRNVLQLYPSVLETLQQLKAKGCLLVAYTESRSFYTQYRMKRLGLDLIFDYLYSPPDHGFPEGKTPEDVRLYPPDYYKMQHTQQNFTPEGETKPSPDILRTIVREVGSSRHTAAYVGDDLVKDILMAQQAGVSDFWAKYGTAHERPEYELLKRVTHWSEQDVRRQRDTTPGKVTPTHVLTDAFSELLEYVEPIKAESGERQ